MTTAAAAPVSPSRSEVESGLGSLLIVIRLGWGVIYRSFAHEANLGGVSVNRAWCARWIATTALVVDAEIVLGVLVVIFGSNSIVTSRCFLCKCEVTLVYLGGVSSDALARAMAVVCLILGWPSRLLVGWPVAIKATARPLIWC